MLVSQRKVDTMFGRKKTKDKYEQPAWGEGSGVQMHPGFGKVVPPSIRKQGLEWAIMQLVSKGMAVQYATDTDAYLTLSHKPGSMGGAGALGFILAGPVGAAVGVVGAAGTGLTYGVHVTVNDYGVIYAETTKPTR